VGGLGLVCVTFAKAQNPHESDVKRLINDALVRRHASVFLNPRLATVRDARDDYERACLQAGSCSFIVGGDFTGDGNKYYAIAGKYDNPRDPMNSSFILILMHKDGEFIRRFLTPVVSDRVFLDISKCKNGRDGIAYALTLNSDHGAHLAWNGKTYVAVSNCEE
jgi:hypothetical protein